MKLILKSAALLAPMLFAGPIAESAQNSPTWYSGWPMDVVCDSAPLRVKRYLSPPPGKQLVLEYLVGENIFYFDIERENAEERMVFSRLEDAKRDGETEDQNLLRLMVKYLSATGVLRTDTVIKTCLAQMENLHITVPKPELTYEARMRALTEASRERAGGKPYEQLPAPAEPPL